MNTSPIHKNKDKHIYNENYIYNFKTETGRQLSVKGCYLKHIHSQQKKIVNVTDEIESSYVFKNCVNVNFKIPKQILKENNINIDAEKLELPDGLYEHWLNKEAIFPLEFNYSNINDLIKNNLHILIEKRDIILKRGDFYFIKSGSFVSRHRSYASFSISLGQWLDNIDSFTVEMETESDKIEKVAVYYLSERFEEFTAWQGWAFDTKRLVRGKNRLKEYSKLVKLFNSKCLELNNFALSFPYIQYAELENFLNK